MSRADTIRTTESQQKRKFTKRFFDAILKLFCPRRARKKKTPKSPPPEKRSMFTFPPVAE